MFDFRLIIQFIQNKQFDQVLEILQTTLATRTSMVISETDRKQLFELFLCIHRHAMQYPENSLDIPAKSRGVVQVRSPRPSFFSPLTTWAQEHHLVHPGPVVSSSVFSPRIIATGSLLTARAIMRSIYQILRSLEPVTQTNRFSLMDFIFAEEQQELNLLHNVIIQELFFEHLRFEGSPYFQLLLTDPAFVARVGQAINLNLLRGEYGQSLLNCAIVAGCPNQIFELLIQCGANVNGERGESIFPSPIHRSRGIHHEIDLFHQRACLRPIAPEAKIYARHQEPNPITQALYAADIPKALYLVQHPLFQLLSVRLTFFASEDASRITSPLMLASYFGDITVVQALIEKGVDVNVRDNSGESALFYAIRGNQIEATNLLIEAGASLKFHNGSNHSIFDLLKIFQYPEIVEYFSLIHEFNQMGLR